MLKIECSCCGKELEAQGALAFSPPDIPFGMVDKFHICRACWYAKVRPVLRRLVAVEEPVTKEQVAEGLATLDGIFGPTCWCCGQPAPNYQDRHGDDWCDWCHDNGTCTDKMGHLEQVVSVPSVVIDRAIDTDTNVTEHTHSGSGTKRREVHTHAWGSIPHSHILRAICQRPECAGFPPHNIHAGPEK